MFRSLSNKVAGIILHRDKENQTLDETLTNICFYYLHEFFDSTATFCVRRILTLRVFDQPQGRIQMSFKHLR